MLILASTSPTRKSLLDQAGVAFSVDSPGVDERALEAGGQAHAPPELAVVLACAKAEATSLRRPRDVVLGCDQVLELEGKILHKPADRDEALARLEELSGKTHLLHSGAALCRSGKVLWSGIESARLTMRRSTSAERVLSLDRDPSVASSVGAYRLEGPGIQLIEKIEGDYFAILGLPLLSVLTALRTHAPELLEPQG